MVGPLLVHLEQTLAPGGTVSIYSPRPVHERESVIQMVQARRKLTFQNITVQQLEVAKEESFLALHEVSSLKLETFDSIFVLADVDYVGSRRFTDELNIALVVKMMRILNQRLGGTNSDHVFQPVVQVCNNNTARRLRAYGLVTFFNTDRLVGLTLAQVAMKRRIHSVLIDILSCDDSGGDLDVCILEAVLQPGQSVPPEVSFAEVVAMASENIGGNRVIAGWTKHVCRTALGNIDECGVPNATVWEINPVDKMSKRPWSSNDRLATLVKGTVHPLEASSE